MTRPVHPELVEHIEREDNARFWWTECVHPTPSQSIHAPEAQRAVALSWLAFDTLSFVDAFERGER